MKMSRVSLQILFGLIIGLSFLRFTNGKIKPWGNWNKPFPRENNMSLATYYDIIAEKINNETEVSGHQLSLSTADFDVNRTLYGVTLQGKVHYLNPIVTEFANVSRCFMATFHNRSEDQASALDISCIRVSNISLFYDLKADLSIGDVTGTIEVKLTPYVDFMFRSVHTYETNSNKVTPLDIYFTEQNHDFQPRTVQIYAIETATDTETGINVWYGKDLINWHANILSPLIEKMSEGLKYPADPY